ncbi:Immunoglobulin domain-containing protein, partial [Pseudarcicella hirudinis]
MKLSFRKIAVTLFSIMFKGINLAFGQCPLITQQPASQFDCVPNSIVMTVTATGNNLTYQWQRSRPSDGGVFVNLPVDPGYQINLGTPNVLQIQPTGGVENPSRTRYRVIVSNGSCSVTSEPAEIKLNDISLSGFQATCAGSKFNLSVVFSEDDLNARSYQWEKLPNGQTDWIPVTDSYISGTNTHTLTFDNIPASEDRTKYRCKVFFNLSPNYDNPVDNCQKTTNEISLTVYPVPPVPIHSKETIIDACIGDKITLNSTGCSAEGGTTSWYDEANQLVASSAIYIFNASVPGAKNYKAICSKNGCSSPQSSGISVTVYAYPGAPKVTVSPVSGVVCQGNPVSLTATKENTGNTVRWYTQATGGSAVSTSNNSLLTAVRNVPSSEIVPIDANTPRVVNYWVDQSNGGGCRSPRSAISFTVNPGTLISSQPVDQKKCAGQDVVFSVIATGSGLSYQWKKGNVILTDGGKITGSKTANLTISTIDASDATNTDNLYSCSISGSCGAISSAFVDLSVSAIPDPPLIVSHISECESTGEESLNLHVNGLNLKWYSAQVQGNLLGTDLKIDRSLPAVQSYWVSQTNAEGCESARSQLDVLIDRKPEKPIILNTGSKSDFCNSEPSFTLKNTCKTGTSFFRTNEGTWEEKDESLINPPDFNTNASLRYDFKCVNKSQNNCESEVVTQVIQIKTAPIITQNLKDLEVCEGSDVSFSIIANAGGSPLNYLWKKEETSTNGTEADFKINKAGKSDEGEYRCIISANGCSVTSNIAKLTIVNNVQPQLEYAKEKCLDSEVLPISYEPKGGNFSVNSTEAIIDSQTGKLTTNKGGVFEITYSVNDNCGISKAISEIAIISVEAPIVIGAKACLGSQVSLTASGCENGGLLWFEENGTSVDMPITFSKSVNYYAKCLKGECLSEKSNLVSIEETTTTHAQLEYAKEKCLGSEVLPISYEPKGG